MKIDYLQLKSYLRISAIEKKYADCRIKKFSSQENDCIFRIIDWMKV